MLIDPLVDAFERQLRRSPTAPLIVATGRCARVCDIDALAREMLASLPALPRTPGTLVGVAACHGPGLPAALVAFRRAGLVALLLDAEAPALEQLRIVEQLGAVGLLRCRRPWPTSGAEWEWIAAPGDGGGALLPGSAVVKLTSGSTGTPRGIATSLQSLLADDTALTSTMGIRPTDRLLATVPLSHSYGLSSLVIPALVRGTVLVLPDAGLHGPFTAAEQLGATVFPTVPAYLGALVRTSELPPLPPALRLVLSAGAPLAPATAARFREAFGLPVHSFYGSSESGGICYDREGGAAERGSVGTPVDGVTVELQPLPGIPGDGVVTVRSAAVADAYLPHGDPRLEPGRFVTNDVGSWRDGELALVGRQDLVVNIKGKKVDPREVEEVLARLAGVEEVAVLGVPVPERDGEVLRAVVACDPERLSAAEVLAWCRTHLASHKVPRSLILVQRMPRTARGKLDRSALLALRAGSEPGLAG
jgi:acyl-coenzyme A synthetase/AMP-(fatty) acid ligase